MLNSDGRGVNSILPRADAVHREYITKRFGIGEWDIDFESGALFFDGCFMQELGYESGNYVGNISCLKENIHEDDYAVVMNQFKKYLKGKVGTVSIDFRFRNIKDEYVWFRFISSIVGQNDKGDITTIKGGVLNIDHEFKDKRELEKALKSSKAKTDFLSRMSHEIRTPMNAVLGMITLARKTTDIEEIMNYLNKADSSSKQLMSILNDVLDMSKITANKFEIASEKIDLEGMLEKIYNIMEGKVVENNLNFSIRVNSPITKYVVSDELRLTQVIVNLVGNAIKFTPEGGYIELSVDTSPIDNNKSLVHVEVIDTGIGIPEKSIPKLFDFFEQIDKGITKNYGGTGLGLPICKSIVTLMGGRIWVESKQGHGSKFIFEVELDTKDSLPVYEKADSILRDLEMLLVAESKVNIELLNNIFNYCGIKHEVVHSIEEAVSKTIVGSNKIKYDFVLIDKGNPDYKCEEVTRATTELAKNDIPIIVISPLECEFNKCTLRKLNKVSMILRPILPSKIIKTMITSINSGSDSYEETTEKTHSMELSGKKILLAEDIEINREILSEMMKEYDVELHMAEDGVEAVNKFRDNPSMFDVILMDIQMPKLDGLKATKEIRSLDIRKAKDIPIIAMTANAFLEDQKKCLEAGMNGHVAKPIDMDNLLNTIIENLPPQ